MAEPAARSPLETYAAVLSAVEEQSAGALAIGERALAGQLTLRLDPGSSAAQAAARVLGGPLPLAPNTAVRHDGREVLWLGPTEWLIVDDEPDVSALAAGLIDALQGHHAAVVDVSAQRTIVEVRGPAAREVLAMGCALDLHPAVFGPGRCAQTMLARAHVILLYPEASDRLLVFVRASFARYLADWLLDASSEHRAAHEGAHAAAVLLPAA